MRFPKLTQLDRDQAAIYRGAAIDGTVLIAGPPGTGKTIIAFHRAHSLAQRAMKPRVMVYNKVLAKYTENRGSIAKDVDVSTLHSWVWGWWLRMNGGRRGEPIPTLDGDMYSHDWGAIRDKVMRLLGNGTQVSVVHLGHLIIDEGQDFSADMYSALRIILEVGNAKGANPPMGMTVLADENQRLQANQNATLAQIRESLGLSEKDGNVFYLKRNYRNTIEIARLASRFYVGLATGKPDLPKERGPLPVLSKLDHETHGKLLNACVQQITRYVKAHPTHEVGVIAMRGVDREKMFNRLSNKFEGEDVVVQTYSSKEDDGHPVSEMEFDEPGRVTILNYQSAKGLEFDSLFIIDPGQLCRGGASEVNAKMTLYVMCSRAREYLNIMLVADEVAATIVNWLGDSSLYEEEEL